MLLCFLRHYKKYILFNKKIKYFIAEVRGYFVKIFHLWLSEKIRLVVLLFILTSFGISEIPENYYENSEGKTGAALKSALYHIIKGHTQYPYTSSQTDVWDILEDTDQDPQNSNNILCLYTGWSRLKSSHPDGWNREHVWSKSRGDFGTDIGAGTDIHHLRPADCSVNSAKNNRFFDNGGTIYVDGDGTTECRQGTNWTWEPGDLEKGDVARMIFYMATRYEGENGEPDLILVDSIPPSDTHDPVYGKLSTLLEWHQADTVTDYERTRNDKIYSWQNNRNPFIDHPEYANKIWGNDSITSIQFTSTNITKNEADISCDISLSILNGSSTANTTSQIILKSGNNEDIESFSTQNITFPANDYSNQTVTVNITDDTILEDAEDIVFAIRNINGGSAAIAGKDSLFTLTLEDNEFDENILEATDLFISEYIEGSSYNKAIEIFNGTGSSIDLSAYSLELSSNGADFSNSITLSSTLNNNTTYVISHSNASSEIQSQTDINNTSVINFNGNDPVRLLKNNTEIDRIGEIGVDFGSDKTLIRKSSISSPSSTYNSTDWLSFAKDMTDSLGNHSMITSASGDNGDFQARAIIRTTGLQNFGNNTSVDVDFSTLSGSGYVKVKKFNSMVTGTNGIPENYNISNYYWELTKSDDITGFAAQIRFNLSEITNSGIIDPNNVKIYKRETAKSTDFSAISIQTEGDELVTETITSFSQITFASEENDFSLPVELNSFIITQKDGKVILRWITESEIENLGFIIYKATKEQPFYKLADFISNPQLSGKGTTSSKSSYKFVDNNVLPGNTYFYKLCDVDFSGQKEFHPADSVKISSQLLSFQSPYPNPFNSTTEIHYYLPNEKPVDVIIYNMLGQPVKILCNQIQPSGKYKLRWNGRNDSGKICSNGIYFLKFTAGDYFKTCKLIFLK